MDTVSKFDAAKERDLSSLWKLLDGLRSLLGGVLLGLLVAQLLPVASTFPHADVIGAAIGAIVVFTVAKAFRLG